MDTLAWVYWQLKLRLQIHVEYKKKQSSVIALKDWNHKWEGRSSHLDSFECGLRKKMKKTGKTIKMIVKRMVEKEVCCSLVSYAGYEFNMNSREINPNVCVVLFLILCRGTGELNLKTGVAWSFIWRRCENCQPTFSVVVIGGGVVRLLRAHTFRRLKANRSRTFIKTEKGRVRESVCVCVVWPPIDFLSEKYEQKCQEASLMCHQAISYE